MRLVSFLFVESAQLVWGLEEEIFVFSFGLERFLGGLVEGLDFGVWLWGLWVWRRVLSASVLVLRSS